MDPNNVISSSVPETPQEKIPPLPVKPMHIFWVFMVTLFVGLCGILSVYLYLTYKDSKYDEDRQKFKNFYPGNPVTETPTRLPSITPTNTLHPTVTPSVTPGVAPT